MQQRTELVTEQIPLLEGEKKANTYYAVAAADTEEVGHFPAPELSRPMVPAQHEELSERRV